MFPGLRRVCPEVFLGKGILRISSKITEEHPSGSMISIKSQSNFIEITFRPGCALVNLLHVFSKAFPKNSSGPLLLMILHQRLKMSKSIISVTAEITL